MRSVLRQSWLAGSVLLAVGLDQWTKFLVKSTMSLYDSVEVIGNFFRITYIRNTGIAFGILHNAQNDSRKLVLSILSLLAIGFLVYLYARSKKTVLDQLSVGFILGGACGNLYDRITHHFVVDFCDFGIASHRWFTFNLADSAIVLGLILLFVQILIEENQKKKTAEMEAVRTGPGAEPRTGSGV